MSSGSDSYCSGNEKVGTRDIMETRPLKTTILNITFLKLRPVPS